MAGRHGNPPESDHAGSAARPPRRVLTVRQLNEHIQAALQEAFSEPVWVRGEVQRLAPDAASRQHVYFELHEAGRTGAAGYQIPAAILGWDRKRHGLGRYLDGSDPTFRLQDKIEACLLCRIEFYPPYGKVSLNVVGIDPEYSLGQLEIRRRQVLEWLKRADLLTMNAGRHLPDLPLRIGLITSRGSAAAQDVCASLAASGFPFALTLIDCRMQGEQTAPQVVAALARLAAEPLDAVLIARGGGSRADLSWFDLADLCEAIARCPLPIITAIGHEIDTSLADLCAHTRCKTPTAAAGFLVERLQLADQRLAGAGERLGAAAMLCLHDARRRLDGCRRLAPLVRRSLREKRRHVRSLADILESRTGRAVDRWRHRMLALTARLSQGARRTAAAARMRTGYLGMRLVSTAPRAVSGFHRRLESTSVVLGSQTGRLLRSRVTRLDLLAARIEGLDPSRLLSRGFTLTLDDRGRVLRSAAALKKGQILKTRFADGEVGSLVTEPSSRSGPAQRASGTHKGGDHGDKEDTGQQALF